MQDKRVRFICKNIILIAMTLSLLIFFGGSHAVMGRFMAAENDWPEGTESTEGAEFVYGEEELDTTTEDTESSENTEISEHTESTENTQTTETEENLPPVTPEGAAVAVEYVGFIGDGTGAKSLYYTSLQAAFDGLSTITDAQSALSVVLLQDMVLTETLVNTSDANFLLDLAGHTMTLAPGVQINYGNGKVRLTTGTGSHGGIQCGSVASYGPAAGSDVVDHPETSEEDQEEAAGDVTAEEPEAGNTEEPEGGETPEAPENGVQVPLEDQPVLQPLMVGTGELTFLKGTYENAYGSVASGFDKINAEGGYFIAGGADVFTEIVTDITISDNTNMFFGVDAGYEVLGTSEAVMNLPEGKVLVRATVSLDGRTLRGYVVGDPDYAVNGNGVTTYYGTFDKAYEYAREASLGTGLIHSITLLDPEITEVPVEESYVQSATEGAVPQIHIIGMNLVRDIRFTGEMFRVNAGKLVLTDCMVCGNVAEEGYVEGGLIVVAGEATLTLRGDEKGTVITGNRGLYTTDHEEAGAGIVLAEGATLDLAGNVSVANNYERYLNPAGEDELFARNIYLLGNANIVISGPITSGSQ